MHAVVFIDERLPDAASLATAIDPDVLIVMINAGHDGISQITATLANMGQVGTIHIISHGRDGALLLGSTLVDENNLADYQQDWSVWQQHLAAGADVLLYGCNVAASALGESFVAALARYTGADVAASSDVTGSSAAGGDWELEASAGAVDLSAALAIAPYAHTLDALDGTSGNDSLTGTSGADTLRGFAGDDLLSAGAGDDLLEGGTGSDYLDGGTGFDTISYANAGSAILVHFGDQVAYYDGDSAIDTLAENSIEALIGSAFDDTVNGGYGTDGHAVLLSGGAGNDYLVGGIGADTLVGGVGNDTLISDAGDDLLEGGADDDYMYGGDGIDTASYAAASGGVAVDLSVLTAQNTGTDGSDVLDHIENLTGSDGNDSLTGNDFGNVLTGGLGADTLSGGLGDDTIEAGAGDDWLDGGAGFDTVSYADASSAVYVHFGSQVALPDGESGVDVLAENSFEAVIGSAFDDTVNGGYGTDGHAVLLSGGAGSDYLVGGIGADTLAGGIGNDTLISDAGDDLLEGGAGDDFMYGGDGIDTASYAAASGAVTVDLSVVIAQNTGADGSDVLDDIENLVGGDSNDSLTGNELGNVLTGGLGGDLLNGGLGDDTIEAGAGDDWLDGGAGFDTVSYANASSAIVVNFSDQVAYDDGDSGIDVLAVNSFEAIIGSAFDDLIGVGAAAGGNAMLLSGGDGNDYLSGFIGQDTLEGGDGNDTLTGWDGDDTLIGGTGDDVYALDPYDTVPFTDTDTVVELPGEGTDTVYVKRSYALGANIEAVIINGVADVNVQGNELDNTLLGNEGANQLDGGAGADTLTGGDGNDTYYVDDPDDEVVETGNGLFAASSPPAGSELSTQGSPIQPQDLGSGIDTVISQINYTLTENVEILSQAAAAGDLAGTGNLLPNILNGNEGSNLLDGLQGNDTINGGAGDDTLDGGVEIDSLAGGTGNDTYIVTAGDVLAENTGEGEDTVQCGFDWTLGDNLEWLVITGAATANGNGNALANTLTGNGASNALFGLDGSDSLVGGAGGDTLDGGTEIDTLVGGTGNDTYVVTADDELTENAAQGIDTVQSEGGWTLQANVERLLLTGLANVSGTGNAVGNRLTGNDGDNLLSGLGGRDSLVGGAGSDTLNGGIEVDTLLGGLGDDTYVVTAGDVLTESAGEGEDTVQSPIDWTLSGNLEVLILTAAASTRGTGNALANTLIGNAGNNLLSGLNNGDSLSGGAGNDTLDGGVGADTMLGGLGNDTYLVTNGDELTESPGEGTDSVQSAVSWTLGDNLDRLTLTGLANISGTGNVLNNTLTGNDGDNALSGLDGRDSLVGAAGNDTLDGGASIDTLLGGLGDDTYVVTAGDVLTEIAAQGADTVRTDGNWTLEDNLDNLLLTGVASSRATGNALANSLTGNAGNNLLSGLDASDSLVGAAGNDTLDGGAAADLLQGGRGNDVYFVTAGDVVTENAAEGSDTVYSGADWTLAENLEHVLLTGASNTSGIGNALPNRLTGNAADNDLSGLDGNDTLAGGAGLDTLSGGAGADSFLFDAQPGVGNVDTLIDFTHGVDRIRLDDDVFTQFAAGTAMTAAHFFAAAGATAGHDADDRIIYNTSTGALYYDADGNGTGLAIQFAQMGTTVHPTLTAGDFVIVV